MIRSLLVTFSLLFALSACNTIQGVGTDIKGAGQAISGTAQKTKEKISE